MPGTVFSLNGSAQHLLRLSYVGCPLEQIPEGISCIDREIGWLLEHQTAAEIWPRLPCCIFCEQT